MTGVNFPGARASCACRSGAEALKEKRAGRPTFAEAKFRRRAGWAATVRVLFHFSGKREIADLIVIEQ
jgi:hypothetical protein